MVLRPTFTVPRYDLEVINGVGPKQAYVCPVSPIYQWSTVITAGGVNVVHGGSPIVNPNLVTNSTKGSFKIEGGATQILVRCGYNADISVVSASPAVKIFGRTGFDEWELLHNAASSKTATLTLSLTTDTLSDDETMRFTFCDKAIHLFDCKGNNEIFVLNEIALAGTGTVSDAIIQIKPI